MSDAAASTAGAPLYEKDHLRQRQCRHGMMVYNINDRYIGAMLDQYGSSRRKRTRYSGRPWSRA